MTVNLKLLKDTLIRELPIWTEEEIENWFNECTEISDEDTTEGKLTVSSLRELLGRYPETRGSPWPPPTTA